MIKSKRTEVGGSFDVVRDSSQIVLMSSENSREVSGYMTSVHSYILNNVSDNVRENGTCTLEIHKEECKGIFVLF